MENWTRYWKKNPNQIALNTFKVQWTAQLRDSHEWRCECKWLCYWPAARPTLPPMNRSTYEKKYLWYYFCPLLCSPFWKKNHKYYRLNEWKSIIWYCILPSFRITHFEDLIDRVYYLNLRAALKEKCVLFRLFNEKVNPPSSYKPRFLQFLSSWPKQKQ